MIKVWQRHFHHPQIKYTICLVKGKRSGRERGWGKTGKGNSSLVWISRSEREGKEIEGFSFPPNLKKMDKVWNKKLKFKIFKEIISS